MTGRPELLPPPDPTRQERVWSAVSNRLEAGRPRRFWLPVGLGVAAMSAAAALAAFVWWPRAVPWEGPDFESGPSAHQLQLADGSLVVAEPSTTLSRCASDAPCISLIRGRAEFRVKRQRAGTFRVMAGRVEVRVVGTRFTVERDGADPRDSSVEVRVSEGRVDVLLDGARAASVSPGERWRAPVSPRLEEPLDAGPEMIIEPPGQPPTPTEDPPRSPVQPKPARPNPPLPSADELWNAALAARIDGATDQELDHYQRFLQRFPNDGRAGVAAFELARLMVDVRQDPRRAVPLLELALSRQPRGAYAEDAMMRLARAKAARG